MANITNIYSDLDLTFNLQPATRDVSISTDSRAVINSVKNLLNTNFYDRVWQPNLGSNLSALLFENVEPIMESVILQEVKNVLNNFEPRIKINTIKVSTNSDENGYDIYLSFYIGNNTQLTQVTVFLERNR